MSVTIRKKVSLEPKYIDKNYKNHLHKKLVTKFQGSCSEEHGYITEIGNDIEIIGNFIDTRGYIIFDIKLNITALKPEKNVIYTAQVMMIDSVGIFVTVEDKLQIIIPEERAGKYKYNEEDETFKYKKKVISENSTVRVQLLEYRFENNSFQCIGKLVKKKT